MKKSLQGVLLHKIQQLLDQLSCPEKEEKQFKNAFAHIPRINWNYKSRTTSKSDL